MVSNQSDNQSASKKHRRVRIGVEEDFEKKETLKEALREKKVFYSFVTIAVGMAFVYSLFSLVSSIFGLGPLSMLLKDITSASNIEIISNILKIVAPIVTLMLGVYFVRNRR